MICNIEVRYGQIRVIEVAFYLQCNLSKTNIDRTKPRLDETRFLQIPQ